MTDCAQKRRVFTLKYRDTLPILEVELRNPGGSIHDLSGAMAVYLHVRLSDGTPFLRTMSIQDPPTAGIVRYAWQPDDFDPAHPFGFLIPSPDWNEPWAGWHQMEYEAVAGDARLTFPNGGSSYTKVYDELRVAPDLGQGA